MLLQSLKKAKGRLQVITDQYHYHQLVAKSKSMSFATISGNT